MFRTFFAILIFLASIICCILFVSDQPIINPLHPQFETMLKGNALLNDSLGVFGLLFGVAVISVMTYVMIIGARKPDKTKTNLLKKILLSFGVAYALLFTVLFFTHQNYVPAGPDHYFLGFPPATAWMLFGMFGLPVTISLIYIFKFDELIISPEELEEFDRIVQERSKKTVDGRS